MRYQRSMPGLRVVQGLANPIDACINRLLPPSFTAGPGFQPTKQKLADLIRILPAGLVGNVDGLELKFRLARLGAPRRAQLILYFSIGKLTFSTAANAGATRTGLARSALRILRAHHSISCNT